jgi:hypothetical protein
MPSLGTTKLQCCIATLLMSSMRCENEAECILDTLQHAASPPKGLRASVDWLMEQRPVIIESNEQLHGKIQELREGLPDVSHLVEIFQALEKTCMHLGEHVDVLQRGIVTVGTESARGFPNIEETTEAASEPASLVKQLLVKSPNDSSILAVDPETPQPVLWTHMCLDA